MNESSKNNNFVKYILQKPYQEAPTLESSKAVKPKHRMLEDPFRKLLF